ncbi:MFS transporter [Cronobacter sakazakii]|uniref:MFS transporter n=1 Tax=Cronobacter sakazakii TaxID=28141 RepID=UPI0028956878|nr:MFS transporter [Cronobacter sakazakii]MDT3632208.1 MFS transporter [Cronobacter sakazakii]
MTYRNRVTLIYLLGFFLDLINMFIAAVAFPAIGDALHASVTQLSWISNAYIAGLTVVIPLSAWLTQRLGARRLFLLSLALFTVATAACGMATSLESLIFWRVIQGAGGGVLIPVGQALVWQLYAKHERAGLSSAVMLTGLLAPALSPVAGGVIVQTAGWQWVFLASLPLSMLALVMAFCWLRPDAPAPDKRPLDTISVITGAGGLLLVLFGLNELSEKASPWLAAAGLASGMVLMALMLRRCRHHPAPLLRVHLLGEPLMRFSMLVYQCVPGMFIGVNVVGMFWLQTVAGLSPAASGALLVTAFFLMGAGGSLCSSTAQSSAFLHTANTDMPDASALWNINRQLSFCFGVTLVSLALNALLMWFSPLVAWQATFTLAAALTLVPLVFAWRLPRQAVTLSFVEKKEK